VGQSGNALGNSGQQQTYNGIKDVFKTVYKEGGARSLYRGVGMYCPLIVLFPLL
jgi:solute carrier family 25 protein 16